MTKPRFGACLFKRRFKMQKKQTNQSITEYSNIDSLFESVEMRNKKIQMIPNFINKEIDFDTCNDETKFIDYYKLDSVIPPRIDFNGLNKDEFKLFERKVFNAWKTNHPNMFFERNLEIWRQFWIAIERCDVIVHVLDIRCLDLFIIEDIFKYNKKHLLLLNKCDLMNIAPGEYQKEINVKKYDKDMTYFINNDFEYIKYKLNNILNDNIRAFFINDKISVKDILQTYDKSTFAFIGFPNVGKSSTINNLFPTKKVKTSKTPGKTKYLQSLHLDDHVVIDTPGIVFPTNDKIILFFYGILNINAMDISGIINFIIKRIGIYNLVKFYQLKEFINDSRNDIGENFMNYFCMEMKCDRGRGIKIIINDFMDGKIVLQNDITEIQANYNWYNTR